MLSWLTRTLHSSIGKKAIMSLSGLALIGFLIAHLAGNLTFFADADGAAFDTYADTIGNNPLLPIAEVGLTLLFLVHIGLGLRVTMENRKARSKGYMVNKAHGARTPGSRTMVLTGVLVLGFLILHLVHFRLQKGEGVSMAALVNYELSRPFGASAYVVGILALGLHLSHAFRSALQTLGLNHNKYTPIIEKAGLGLAVVLCLGFLAFPLCVFFGGQS